MFDRLLVANRGEIACRVIRTARRMGLRTVAVYSDADAGALHATLADTAQRLGPAPAAESYLSIERVIAAARASGARAVHPGYGFLSENAAFAEACEAAGLVFVGPPAAAIRAMGDKRAAKALMATVGVPLLPGYHGESQDDARLAAEAARIGYPVLIKAAAGGGGKGMRVARQPGEFTALLAACRREARAAFGDDRVLIERLIERPRHVEVQIFADRHGNCVHLHERDCSAQRRHQKVLEEAPAPRLARDTREAMAAAAIAAARAVGYVGAGTVEFILAGGGADAGAFHFLEMNTRLQVEHPVTEFITGLDLVEWQIRIAAGEPLPLAQDAITIAGHAIEARICAEDPARGFLPATGRLAHLRFPAEDARLRVESGVREGNEITPWYDAMIAKLVVHGTDRADALHRMRAALEALEVAGVATNRDLLLALLRSDACATGALDTGFIEREIDTLTGTPPADDAALLLAALSGWPASAPPPRSPWALADGWRVGAGGGRGFEFHAHGQTRRVRLRAEGAVLFARIDGGAEFRVETPPEGRVVHADGRIHVFLDGVHHRLAIADPLAGDYTRRDATHGSLAAPMPGKVIAVLVEEGAHVEHGAPLVIVEAMKMEHTLAAPAAGRISRLACRLGESVAEGQVLLEMDAGDGGA